MMDRRFKQDDNVPARSRQEKAATWAALAGSGTTLAEIGQMEGITRERVRQILRMEGHDVRLGMRGATAVNPHEVMRALRDSSALSAPDTAALIGLTEATVERALKRMDRLEAAKRLWRARQNSAKRARILGAIKEFAAKHGRVPGVKDAIAGTLGISHMVVIKRFGSWNNGIAAAGLTPRPRGGARHR